MTAVFGNDLERDHVSQDSRSETGCVGVDQEKQRIVGEKLCTQLDEWVDGVFNFPDLTLWSTAVGRRVHDDRVVVIATADLALYEFHTVIDKPADRGI